MSNPTPKQYILATYPEAVAVKQPDGTWHVRHNKKSPNNSIWGPLGVGTNPNTAWKHAAEQLAETVANRTNGENARAKVLEAHPGAIIESKSSEQPWEVIADGKVIGTGHYSYDAWSDAVKNLPTPPKPCPPSPYDAPNVTHDPFDPSIMKARDIAENGTVQSAYTNKPWTGAQVSNDKPCPPSPYDNLESWDVPNNEQSPPRVHRIPAKVKNHRRKRNDIAAQSRKRNARKAKGK